MTVELDAIVTEVLARAPEWLRRDLAADDPKTRAQAEETLAAMLSAALNQMDGSTEQ